MNKFVLNVVYDEKNNAGSKAKADVTTILLNQLQFKEIKQVQFRSKLEKLQGQHVVNQICAQVEAGDVLLIQYPTYFGHFWEKRLFKQLGQKNVKIIILLHDVDVLRVANLPRYKNLEWVTRLLNMGTVLISPNQAMSRLLTAHGLTLPMITLKIYDYLQAPRHTPRVQPDQNQISFAGNLNKSSFLYQLPSTDAYQLFLFGMLDNQRQFEQANLHYQGIFPPDDLKDRLPDGFGLVWDGGTPDELTGLAGQYLKYNNPHKVSLYLSSGLPVIVPAVAAIADFVTTQQVGLVISGLSELPAKLATVTADEYHTMQGQVAKVGAQLRAGTYTVTAVEQALAQVTAIPDEVR
ncbi:hypothetical protein C5Z26_00635 [Lactobacillus sp. CBA3606]|uniref:sugar transferase n=1 Tax=Lactobacillus sp. CBA3606 TaxID=2099789 RepID=UPI000CFE14CC|nr:sugar transferase [Lactobacillus sp. CBA3606]AVK62734.1 hypothetical protein C5Z26_00635 [Lactobacillus sp. CBA3606]